MLDIINGKGIKVDEARSFNEACNIIMFLDRTNTAEGPHTCRSAE